jgi:hypothetical protein
MYSSSDTAKRSGFGGEPSGEADGQDALAKPKGCL